MLRSVTARVEPISSDNYRCSTYSKLYCYQGAVYIGQLVRSAIRIVLGSNPADFFFSHSDSPTMLMPLIINLTVAMYCRLGLLSAPCFISVYFLLRAVANSPPEENILRLRHSGAELMGGAINRSFHTCILFVKCIFSYRVDLLAHALNNPSLW